MGVLLAFLILIQAGLLWASLAGPTTPVRVVATYQTLVRQRLSLEANFSRLLAQRATYESSTQCANESLSLVRSVLSAQNSEASANSDIEVDLDVILSPYLIHSNEVFNLTEVTGNFIVTFFEVEGGDTLVPKFRHIDPKLRDGVRDRKLPLAGTHAGRCVSDKKAIITPDLSNVTEFVSLYDEIDRDRYGSLASIPVFCGAEVVGALCVSSDTPHQFTAESAGDIFETIGSILSVYYTYRRIDANNHQAL